MKMKILLCKRSVNLERVIALRSSHIASQFILILTRDRAVFYQHMSKQETDKG